MEVGRSTPQHVAAFWFAHLLPYRPPRPQIETSQRVRSQSQKRSFLTLGDRRWLWPEKRQFRLCQNPIADSM